MYTTVPERGKKKTVERKRISIFLKVCNSIQELKKQTVLSQQFKKRGVNFHKMPYKYDVNFSK